MSFAAPKSCHSRAKSKDRCCYPNNQMSRGNLGIND